MPEKKVDESLLFNYETTTRTDYRHGDILPLVNTTYKIKEKCPRPPYVPLKDLHALTPWKNPILPFDLYHRTTNITRIDPRVIQKRYVPQPDLDRAKIQRIRPQNVMTPALWLDKIEEPTRQILVNDIYKSVVSKALNDALKKVDIKHTFAPLPEVYSPSNPVKLKPFRESYVSPEWRMESVSWDKKQLRMHTEPTKSFWLFKPPPYCRSCKETEIIQTHRRRICQAKFEGPR